MKRWPAVAALAMLLTAWGLLRLFYQGEQILAKKPFAEFPLTIAERWQGKEFDLEQNVLDVLKLSDYIMRAYVPTNGQSSPLVWLYVGYHQSQRAGATYHSPKLCLPGAGWQLVELDQVSVPVEGRIPITINKVLTQKGLDKQVVLYWYHDRGRVIANEYWAKSYMIWDAITQHRTDGSLVRISVPVTTTSEAAYQQGLVFLRDFWPILQEYMPVEDRIV
jgi:EpsI family protein